MNLLKIAKRYRRTERLPETEGVVIIFQNAADGWMSALRSPESWVPGCIAIDAEGNQWLAVGGNAYDGAAEWQPIDASIQSQRAA